MAKKLKKKDIDQEMLNTLFAVEYEWKQMQSIIDKSIEPTIDGSYWLTVAQIKYLYLLREIRRRDLSANQYSKKR